MLLTGAVCPDPVIFSSYIYMFIICPIINTATMICFKLRSVSVFVGLLLSLLAFNLFM
jgi:hypothetical protein